MPKNTQARIAANNKYNAKAYDRINIAVHKGTKDKIKEQAEKQGMTVNGYICMLIDKALSEAEAQPEQKEQ